ncbi:MAG: hypothetical protein IJK64_07315 [Clostridia bacterium]|nr:hypothetical protein [Clostridia bacterium]
MKKALSICLALAMLAALLPSATLAQALTNVPPAAHYYTITSDTDLYNFGRQLYAGNPLYCSDAYVELANDIDMSAYAGLWESGPFYGTFDGGGNTISNLNATSGGLFDILPVGALVKDLTIADSSIDNYSADDFPSMTHDYVGAIANLSDGVIMNCALVNTKVMGACLAVGGFVGRQGVNRDGPTYVIDDTLAAPSRETYYLDDPSLTAIGGVLSCTVDGDSWIENTYPYIMENFSFFGSANSTQRIGIAGGIVGETNSCIIDDCKNEASVTGLRVGGILGDAQAGVLIRYCSNYGKVTQPEDVVDKLMEDPDNGFATMQPISLADYAQSVGSTLEKKASEFELAAGGILGIALDGGTNIQNCMNYGSVKSLFNVGGIVGYLEDPCSLIINCGCDYKEGYVDYGSAISGVYNMGGLVGHMTIHSGPGVGMDHQNAYAASTATTGPVIYNSYNAMPLRAAGEFYIAHDFGVAGGLVGRIDASISNGPYTGPYASIENCHNAAIPKEIETVSYLDHVGSFVGYLDLDCPVHIIHCCGAINDRKAYNYTTTQYEPMFSSCAEFPLIGFDGPGIQQAPGYYFDNRMYVMDQQVIWDFVDPTVTLVCGGILISDGPSTPSIYTQVLGTFSQRNEVLDELNAYVLNYPISALDFDGRWVELTSRMLEWNCADPAHVTPHVGGCPEYAIIHAGPANFMPIPTQGPEPGVIWETPADPDAPAFDPNEPGVTVTHSLSLEGDICVNFYASVPTPDPACYMEFVFNDTTLNVPIDLNRFIERDGVALYKFSCPLNASQTSTEVQATIWVPDDGSFDPNAGWGPIFGNGYCGKMLEPYSVNRYLEEVSQNPSYQNNAPLMDLMRSISVYGFYTNELFRTDPAFMPSPLFDASAIDGIDAAALASYAADTQDFGTQVAYYGSSLVLRTTTAIRHYFTLAPGEDIEDYTVVCSNTGETLIPEQNGSYYCVEIPNIASGNLGTNYIVQVYAPGSAAPVSVWTYAGLSYAYKVLTQYENGGNISDELANVARALYVYYACADAYFG